MTNSILFNKLTGLDTQCDPSRIYSVEPVDRFRTGVAARLAIAENVVIDESGGVSSRVGSVVAASGSWHSLHACGDYAVGVSLGNMYAIIPGSTIGSVETIVIGTGYFGRVSWADVNGVPHFTSRKMTGKVVDKVVHGLEKMEYGRDSYSSFSGAPAGDHIAFHLGRLWISVGQAIYFSEPLGFNLFNKGESSFMLSSGCLGIAPVNGGAYIFSEDAVYFLSGAEPKEFKLEQVLRCKQLDGGVCRVDGSVVGMELAQSDVSIMFCCENGIYIGSSSGAVRRLTNSVVFPTVGYGGAVFSGNTYTMFSCGTM